MEDTQNSAPDALEASKLNSSAQRGDTQSVTKRFVSPASPKKPEQSLLANHVSWLTSVFNVACRLS